MNTFRRGRVEGKLIKGFEIEMEVDTYWPQFEISRRFGRLRKYAHVPSFHRFFHAVSFFFSPPLFCPLLHRFNSRSLTSSTLDREIPTLSLFRVVARLESSRGRNFHPLHGSPVTILEISPEFLETRAQRSNVLTLARSRDTQSRSLATRPPLHPLSLTREFHPSCIRLRDALGLIHPRATATGRITGVTNSRTFLTLCCRDRWPRSIPLLLY